jgi:hypothetical protein
MDDLKPLCIITIQMQNLLGFDGSTTHNFFAFITIMDGYIEQKSSNIFNSYISKDFTKCWVSTNLISLFGNHNLNTVVSRLSTHLFKYTFFGKKFRVQDSLVEHVMNLKYAPTG